MNYLAPAALTVEGIMDSPHVSHIDFSEALAPSTPSQRNLLERNDPMIDSMLAAIEQAGRNGVVVSSQAIWNARRLMQLLPSSMPPTDSYVSVHESICFDWDEDPSCQLSLIVQRGGKLAFSAFFGGDRINGSLAFSPVELPEEIGRVVQRWVRESRYSPGDC